LGKRFPSAAGPRPLVLLLSKDFFPKDVDLGLLNLLGSRRRTWTCSVGNSQLAMGNEQLAVTLILAGSGLA
jgi:hypothetical protein